jgi:hypothetical protein
MTARLRLLGGWLIAGAVLAAATHSVRITAQQAGTPRALIAEAGHDFGPVEPGSRYSHTFALRNTGTAPLTIHRIECSAPGMRSRFKSPLLPGETAPVTVEWEIDRPAGDLDAQAVIHVSDPTRPRITYAMTAVVRRSVELLPSPDVFLSLYQDQDGNRSVRIVNNDDRPLSIRQIRTGSDRVRAEIRPVEPGRVYELMVGVPAGLEPGRYVEAIEVETDHPRLATLHLDVNVVVRKELFASPEIVDFGEARRSPGPGLPAFRSQSVTLKKRKGDFAIIEASSDIPALRVEQSPRGRSDSFGLLISIDPERLKGADSLDGSIRIRTDDKDFPEIVIPVTGRVR